MQATINISRTQNTTTKMADTANAIIRRESTQKIIMFIAILVSLVGAVNL
jgi:hypothetical protein